MNCEWHINFWSHTAIAWDCLISTNFLMKHAKCLCAYMWGKSQSETKHEIKREKYECVRCTNAVRNAKPKKHISAHSLRACAYTNNLVLSLCLLRALSLFGGPFRWLRCESSFFSLARPSILWQANCGVPLFNVGVRWCARWHRLGQSGATRSRLVNDEFNL